MIKLHLNGFSSKLSTKDYKEVSFRGKKSTLQNKTKCFLLVINTINAWRLGVKVSCDHQMPTILPPLLLKFDPTSVESLLYDDYQ